MPPRARFQAPTAGGRRLGLANPYVTNSHAGPLASDGYDTWLVGWPHRGDLGDPVSVEGASRSLYDHQDRFNSDTWFCELTNPVPDAQYMEPRGDSTARRHAEAMQRETAATLERKEQETARRRSARLQAQRVASDAIYQPIAMKVPTAPNWFGVPAHVRTENERCRHEAETQELENELARSVYHLELLRRQREDEERATRGELPPTPLTAAEKRAMTRAARRSKLERLLTKRSAQGRENDLECQEARAELARMAILALREAERPTLEANPAHFKREAPGSRSRPQLPGSETTNRQRSKVAGGDSSQSDRKTPNASVSARTNRPARTAQLAHDHTSPSRKPRRAKEYVYMPTYMAKSVASERARQS